MTIINGHRNGLITNGGAHTVGFVNGVDKDRTRQANLANGIDKLHAEPTGDRLATRLIHVGSAPAPGSNAVIPPISLSTTYAQTSIGVHGGFEYSRSSNPNRLSLETLVASLEGAGESFDVLEGGDRRAKCLAMSSGSAATATVINALAGPGRHVLSMSDVYGGTYRYLTKVAKELGVDYTLLDLSLSDPNAPGASEALISRLESAILPNTSLVWIETPTNPTLRLVDVRLVTRIAHARGLRVVVDNTFLSPFYQQPLTLGADVVVHSGTKYLGGHSDVVIGLIVATDPAILSKLRFLQNAHGAVPSPFDCWLTQRGLKTLHLRLRQHGRNALEAAKFLAGEGKANGWVDSVNYAGLPGSPTGALAWSQIPAETREALEAEGFGPSTDRGFPYGGMVSFRIASPASGDDLEDSAAAEAFLESTRLFTLAESLGGVESLAELPARMTHAGLAPEDRAKLGIDGRLIRLSVGVEDAEDLVGDLRQALQRAAEGGAGGGDRSA